MSGAAADVLVRGLPHTTLVVGKGGVGKTTCAAALALRLSAEHDTLLLTTDPARTLPAVLGQEIGDEETAVAGAPRLVARSLDAAAVRGRFLDRWGDVIRQILDRGTYLDDSDIGALVDTALPGGDEIFSALALAQLLAPGSKHARVVVDTAPTGHTLRLLNLPRTFRALVRLLDTMQEKHRFMVRTLTRAYRADAADAFLREMTSLVDALDGALHDRGRCAAVMVTNAQPIVLEETRRYLDALADAHIAVGAVVWNAAETTAQLPTSVPQFVVPRLDDWPIGTAGLEGWLNTITIRQPVAGRPPGRKRVIRAGRERATGAVPPGARIRPLTIVAGKGGVGKTTVACVLALQAARDRRTLVVSTDPAPSLADAFEQEIGDRETPVAARPGLFARQMDASAAFARLRSQYQSRVDAVFEGLVAHGVDLTHDRAIVRDLLALAPPGIDEVYALSLIADALFVDQYECVVVDPAPTGHLLRLLEMPQLALSWTHQIMRLMLKYKDVAGLGDSAQELLAFSRHLRALDALLRDASRSGVVLVTLDEPVVRDESRRLAAALRDRSIAILAVVRNRAARSAALPVAAGAVQLEAPDVQPPPVGVAALDAWGDTWRSDS